MARDKVKRAFIWLRDSLRVIDKTTLPGEILGEIRPTLDTFGWERLGGPLQLESNTSGLGSNGNVLTPVPEGIMRYVVYASCSHNDTVSSLTLSLQVRHPVGPTDFGIAPAIDILQAPVRLGLDRRILLAPGQQLACFSTPAPGGAFALTVRMLFIDIPVGEYIPPL